jgi:hypothetical protein
MKNRNGDEYKFVHVSDDTYTIVGDLKYWRYGGRTGQESMDFNDLGFVDPSGGPFISLGYRIEGLPVVRIRLVADQLLFDTISPETK